MWVLATNAAARGITDTGITVGAAAACRHRCMAGDQWNMTLEVLVIVLMLGTEVFRPLRDLRSLLHSGMVGMSAALSIYQILDAEPLVTDTDGGEVDQLDPTISFDHVVFRYPGNPDVAHQNITFDIKAGERVGVVGPSGSGKSTILKLLLRLYEPTTGTIRVGGEGYSGFKLCRTPPPHGRGQPGHLLVSWYRGREPKVRQTRCNAGGT